jgi:xeroderma pigmentosum group C-complementing protein
MPYKVVKARPKYDKMTSTTIKDRPLELFGEWQVEDYIPPPAQDGKVPRNEYGNVELFLPKMLPKGTVHLREPGLFRIAKKLNIDCAPALVGFDFHSGGSHPTYDGHVVCEEFKDLLLDAWREDYEEARKREEAKRVKRVRGNWKKLIRMVIVRRRLEKKYDTFNFGSKEAKTSQKAASSNASSSSNAGNADRKPRKRRRK